MNLPKINRPEALIFILDYLKILCDILYLFNRHFLAVTCNRQAMPRFFTYYERIKIVFFKRFIF